MTSHRQYPGCCDERRLANVHQGFEQGRRNAFYADLDVDELTARHAWRNAIIGAFLLGLIIVGGLIGGPGSY